MNDRSTRLSVAMPTALYDCLARVALNRRQSMAVLARAAIVQMWQFSDAKNRHCGADAPS